MSQKTLIHHNKAEIAAYLKQQKKMHLIFKTYSRDYYKRLPIKF